MLKGTVKPKARLFANVGAMLRTTGLPVAAISVGHSQLKYTARLPDIFNIRTSGLVIPHDGKICARRLDVANEPTLDDLPQEE